MISGRRTGTWQPVLHGELAARARESVERVATRLVDSIDAPGSSFMLPDGSAGTTLVLAHLARSIGRQDLLEAARRTWQRTLETLAEAIARPGLHSGFCGPAWVAAHLGDRLEPDSDGDSQHEEIESALLAHLDSKPHYPNYDLITGLVGYDVYALERWPRGRSRSILDRVVERIAARAEPDAAGVTWTTPPDLLPAPHRRSAPDGYRNLGVAHGIPGLLVLLARARDKGVLSAPAARALEDGVRWLLGAQVSLAGGLRYPHWIPIGKAAVPADGEPGKLAWCYGDLGVSAALLVAADCADRADWLEEAVALARRCAIVDRRHSGVREHGLCHGSAGVALLFARLANATGDESFAAAASRWFDHTLATREVDSSDEGYFALLPRASGSGDPHDVDLVPASIPGFLMGSGGVALALAAGFSNVAPEWDRALLMSA